MTGRKSWGILISGNGSTMQAILDCPETQALVSVVMATRESAYGLKRARRAGIPVEIIPSNKHLAESWILEKLKNYGVSKLFLAGFMRILSEKFISDFGKDSIFNIHPSLLPKYKGAHGFTETLASQDQVAGTTVHRVVGDVDSGQFILQRKFSIPSHREPNLCKVLLSINEQRVIRESARRILWQNQ